MRKRVHSTAARGFSRRVRPAVRREDTRNFPGLRCRRRLSQDEIGRRWTASASLPVAAVCSRSHGEPDCDFELGLCPSSLSA